jgi:hypothetical protein
MRTSTRHVRAHTSKPLCETLAQLASVCRTALLVDCVSLTAALVCSPPPVRRLRPFLIMSRHCQTGKCAEANVPIVSTTFPDYPSPPRPQRVQPYITVDTVYPAEAGGAAWMERVDEGGP